MVTLPIALIGLVLLAVDWVRNAMDYTKVVAQVEQVENVCVGGSITTPIPCWQASSYPKTGRIQAFRAVHVRYTSPADKQQHSGVVYAKAGKIAREAAMLHVGDKWLIYAHDDEPAAVKAID